MIIGQREQKRRLLLRLKGVEGGRPLIGPEVVHLRLTDRCNLACPYCWYYGQGSRLRPRGKIHLSFDLFKGIARDCALLQVDTINLSGIGEPTLHPRFYDMLAYLERFFAVTIFTNGTFPIERCRQIVRANRIIINLGAADRESYRALQGRDLFIKVIKNIRELARLRPQFNPNFFIEVVIVATRLNRESFSRTEDLVKKLGANLVVKKEFEASQHNRGMMLSPQKKKTRTDGAWLPCYHGWFYSAIKLNGDVNVCCYAQSLTMGNVNRASFKDIWESDAYCRARASALRGREPFRNDRDCKNCRATRRNKEIAAQREKYKYLEWGAGQYDS